MDIQLALHFPPASNFFSKRKQIVLEHYLLRVMLLKKYFPPKKITEQWPWKNSMKKKFRFFFLNWRIYCQWDHSAKLIRNKFLWPLRRLKNFFVARFRMQTLENERIWRDEGGKWMKIRNEYLDDWLLLFSP